MTDVSYAIPGIGCLKPKMHEGQTCDLCPEPATRRIQGETDSFGCEWLDHCDYHHGRVMAGAMFSQCDHCESDEWIEIDEGQGDVSCSSCRLEAAA
jgi:hypothetical protein